MSQSNLVSLRWLCAVKISEVEVLKTEAVLGVIPTSKEGGYQATPFDERRVKNTSPGCGSFDPTENLLG